MSLASYWKGNSGNARKPQRQASFADDFPLSARPEDLVQEANLPQAAIAVMGATGTGKSTFINLISGSSLAVSQGLQSCTERVQPGSVFNLDGRRVVLIDTPGFDDTVRSDTDVFKMIAAFLATSYELGFTLAGVLYFHRISDPKMGWISTRNFNMFRKLCGDSTLQNVVIVTNRWGEVEPQVGEAREAELAREDIFFKPVLDKGARMARHDNTAPSAETIVRLILENHPLPLRIQQELVDEHKDISETGAGEELNRELNSRIRKYQEEMRTLKEQMEQTIKDKDEETRKELEIESQRMEGEISRFLTDAKRLESEYEKEKTRLEQCLEQARIETNSNAAQYKQQIDELKDALKANAEASEREKAEMLKKIKSKKRALARALVTAGLGIIPIIGAILGAPGVVYNN